MKKQAYINPDYADSDELDPEIQDAYESFQDGTMDIPTLMDAVGPEMARMIREQRGESPEDYDPDSLLEDLF